MSDERQTRLIAEAVREALEGDGLSPPWVAFGGQARFSSFWFAGAGQWPLMVLLHWLDGLSEDERVAFFAAHLPVPAEWADWVASAVYGEWEHDTDSAIVAQVWRLEREHGLVDAAAWEATLDQP